MQGPKEMMQRHEEEEQLSSVCWWHAQSGWRTPGGFSLLPSGSSPPTWHQTPPVCFADNKLGVERNLGTNLGWGTHREPLVCSRGQAEPQHQPSHVWKGSGKSSNNPNLICPWRPAGRSCTAAFLTPKPRGAAAPVGPWQEQRQCR